MERIKKSREQRRFYVYALMDTRTTKWKGCGYRLPHEPFYIGKGTGNRYSAHLGSPVSQSIKDRLIRKIERVTGEPPSIVIFEDRLTERQALELERYLISGIGRRNRREGPLANLTDGGEGVSGKVFSQEERDRVSRQSSERWAAMSPEERKALAARSQLTIRAKSAEERAKTSAKISENTRRYMAELTVGQHELRAQKRRDTRALWSLEQREEFREKLQHARRAYLEVETAEHKAATNARRKAAQAAYYANRPEEELELWRTQHRDTWFFKSLCRLVHVCQYNRFRIIEQLDQFPISLKLLCLDCRSRVTVRCWSARLGKGACTSCGKQMSLPP